MILQRLSLFSLGNINLKLTGVLADLGSITSRLEHFIANNCSHHTITVPVEVLKASHTQ
jgi:hypothetical protein